MTELEKRRGEATREAILLAAEAVFAEHGYDGARVDSIAEASGYNKTLIFRYFGDKLGLYAAVLKRADRETGDLMAQVVAPLLQDESIDFQAEWFRAFLTATVGSLFDYLLEHPRLVRILTWEMAEGWQTFVSIASQFPAQDTEQFEPLFHRAREAGLLRADFFPAIQFGLFLQFCQVYLASLPLYQALLPKEDVSSVESLMRARGYVVNFIIGGML